jgi:hypothetical protein
MPDSRLGDSGLCVASSVAGSNASAGPPQLVQRRAELPAQDLRLLIAPTWRDRSSSIEVIAAAVPLIVVFRFPRN